ncbi:tRNA methyltransferase 10 homolog B isoform X2 [Xenopus laevis]|uniref:tRNA (guanine(9)-N(1))-methyltransferase n=1 Tax=Xenopus laevis TaxID=8355 RepID=A0A8J0U9I8_XENLA|nr:tRNA methyltransferase 10 homolog B isoform X2 [Xenopus laevis]
MASAEGFDSVEKLITLDRTDLQNGLKDENCQTEEEQLSMDFLSLLEIDSDNDSLNSLPQESGKWCSRNVLRKQRHWEKITAAKKCKRKQEKERRKAKNAQDLQKGATEQKHSKKFLKALTKEHLLEAKDSGPRLCIDLSMTQHMTKKVDTTENSFLDVFPLETVVYLTPDSDNALEDVDPEKVYVIGGLVDESVQKKLTYHKAKDHELQTARLPIQEYMVKNINMKNFHSEILAINQVFDVLSTYYRTRSWVEALQAGVSPGKGYVLRNKTTLEEI